MITTVLIVILVLAGIIIVWNVIAGVLKNSGEETQKNVFAVTLTPDGKINSDSSQVQVKIKRSSGKGEISGIKFLLKGDDGKYYNYIQTTNLPQELETKTYTILYSSLTNFLSNKIVSVQFSPVLKDASGKEYTGMISPVLKSHEGLILNLCASLWTCTLFTTACSDGQFTRTCTDSNNCNPPTSPKPIESLSCSCTSGDRVCLNSTSFKVCDNSGNWGSSQSCSSNYLCDGSDGQCKPASCKNSDDNNPPSSCEIFTGTNSCTAVSCSWYSADACEDNGQQTWGGSCGNIGSDNYDSCGTATSGKCYWDDPWFWSPYCANNGQSLNSCPEVTTAYACEYVNSWCNPRYANRCYGNPSSVACSAIGDMNICNSETGGYCVWGL